MPKGLRATAAFALAALSFGTPATASFVTFESGQVRPLARDGTRLFAVNTPDDRLEIFDVTARRAHATLASVPVGLEPVAVAARSNDRGLGREPPLRQREHRRRRRRRRRASCARCSSATSRATSSSPARAATAPSSPRRIAARTAGVALADSRRPRASAAPTSGSSTPTSLGPTTLGGTPLAIVTLFGDTPRALAVSPDGGTTVYAAVFHSGNQTTTLTEGIVCDGGAGARAVHASSAPRCRAACPLRTPTSRASRPGDRPHRHASTTALEPVARPARPQLEQRRPLHPARPATSSRSTPTPTRRRSRGAASRTSARCSSTWWPTR